MARTKILTLQHPLRPPQPRKQRPHTQQHGEQRRQIRSDCRQPHREPQPAPLPRGNPPPEQPKQPAVPLQRPGGARGGFQHNQAGLGVAVHLCDRGDAAVPHRDEGHGFREEEAEVAHHVDVVGRDAPADGGVGGRAGHEEEDGGDDETLAVREPAKLRRVGRDERPVQADVGVVRGRIGRARGRGAPPEEIVQGELDRPVVQLAGEGEGRQRGHPACKRRRRRVHYEYGNWRARAGRRQSDSARRRKRPNKHTHSIRRQWGPPTGMSRCAARERPPASKRTGATRPAPRDTGRRPARPSAVPPTAARGPCRMGAGRGRPGPRHRASRGRRRPGWRTIPRRRNRRGPGSARPAGATA
ncbi:hypothetical protein DFJ74DRAFT_408087 [Hyaloraphidium curvatum]|nr:hypothetical protein DFJ74DRAFT_408087 [Hyaloraphidium curvatum]